jgi:hypothetical protein
MVAVAVAASDQPNSSALLEKITKTVDNYAARV